ncbi:MAG: ABC transporter substrate-binding protein [Verrucomicrobia bacterium]|nr:ABC transporter substrate-binding protein [Verrucomicrobiota bacterium]
MKRIVILIVALFPGLLKAEDTAQSTAPKKPWRIALSNSFYGNIWRHQMVEAFRDAAEKAKAEGLISEYTIENGDNTVNQQNAQMSGIILRGVDAICINAASPTALNGVIGKACQAGIKVLAFDSIATADCAYKFDFDMVGIFGGMADYIAGTLLHGKGDVLLVRGVEGSAPDKIISDAQKDVLKKYPGIRIVGEIYGQASTSVAQSAVANILPSLPNVDAVIAQGGGDDIGIVQAFEQSGRKLPIVQGGGSSNFLKWWGEQYNKNQYQTVSANTAPGIGGAALWLAIDILNGKDVPKVIKMPGASVTVENLAQYAGMPPGQIVSPTYTQEWVDQNLVQKK